MTSTLSDLLGQADVPIARISDEDQAAAIRLVRRTCPDASLMLDALGLEPA